MKQRIAIQLRNNRRATRHARVASCWLASCLVLASVASTRAWAQEARNPVPPQIVITPHTSVPSAIGASDAADAADSAKAAEVGNAMRTVVGVALWSGALSPEEAWSSGTLTVEDVLALLQQPVGSVDGPHNEEVRRDLAGLLVQHAPERVKDTSKLSAMTRLALVYYYSEMTDARAVDLCEDLVKEKLNGKTKDVSSWPWLWSLIYLAQYYEKTQQWKKAAQTWLRSEKPLAGDAHDARSAAGMLIEAARALKQIGETKKAQELYDRVPQHGDGWMIGLALYDQADDLINHGEHEKARNLLATPVSGAGAGEIKVALLSLLAYSFYLQQEATRARHAAEEAIAQYQLNDKSGPTVEAQVGTAESILTWLEVWAKEPLVCVPRRLRVVYSDQKKGNARLLVRSWRDVPLTATCDNPAVKLHVMDQGGMSEYHFERAIVVEIAPNAKSFEATLVVRSAKYPDFVVDVPLSAESSGS